jgi:hypothetical protein
MSTASLVLSILSVLSTVAGLPCCLGWINWFAVPIASACAVVGLLGIALDRDPATRAARDVNTHLAAVIVGVACVAIGSLRCAAGGGCF